jgi:hypothetical protein
MTSTVICRIHIRNPGMHLRICPYTFPLFLEVLIVDLYNYNTRRHRARVAVAGLDL